MTNYNSSAAAYAPAHGGFPGEVVATEGDTVFAEYVDFAVYGTRVYQWPGYSEDSIARLAYACPNVIFFVANKGDLA